MKKLVTALALCLALSVPAFSLHAAEQPYRYMKASELEQKLKAHEPVMVFDIQVEAEYAQHHIRGAIPTYSYPVKTAEEKAKIDAKLAEVQASKNAVVIVCPRGAGGAERAYRYLLEKGVAAERLYILEKGQAGWSCAELTEGE